MEPGPGLDDHRKHSPYLALFDDLEDMVLFIDENHRITSASESTRVHTGYDPDDIIGLDMWDELSGKSSFDLKKEVLGPLNTNNDVVPFELPLVDPRGKDRTIECRMMLLVDEGGGRAYILSGKDITASMEIARELRRLREDQMLLLDRSTDCVFLVRDGHIEKANRKARETFGYTDLEGALTSSLFKDIADIPKARDPLAEKDEGDMETVLCTRHDGSEFHTEVNYVWFDGSEENRGFLFIKDVSSRLEREAKLRLLAGVIETSSDAVMVMDADGNVVKLNSGFMKIFGIEDDEIEFSPPDLFGGLEEKYLDMMSTLMKGMTWSGYAILNMERGPLEISIKAWPMMDSSGKVENLIVHCRDVSDIKKMESDLELLTSILSHDIRNFDKAITDNIEMLKMGVYGSVDDRQTKVLDRILFQSKEMNSLISNARKVMQSYKELQDMEIFDLRSVVQYAIDVMRSSYPEKEMEFSVDFYDPPPLVRADILIRDIFQNLFDNSIKHSKREVRIMVKGGRDPTGWYSVNVVDDGAGIPEGKGEELFRMFRGSKRSSGSGIGLYLVRRLMKRYHGQVSVQEKGTEEGYGGALFKLDFPRVPGGADLIVDTINTDVFDPVRYILFNRFTRDGETFIEFGGMEVRFDEIRSARKMELIERFGWNISKALHVSAREMKSDGVYRYDFMGSGLSGPIDPKRYGG
ncbi:MAG: PAS domain S-box protein [Candidatus Thermoplasmatota archaeon]|nr:PAS domain S-box protein [Candidatus Thermoplasmatota archaeon]